VDSLTESTELEIILSKFQHCQRSL